MKKQSLLLIITAITLVFIFAPNISFAQLSSYSENKMPLETNFELFNSMPDKHSFILAPKVGENLWV